MNKKIVHGPGDYGNREEIAVGTKRNTPVLKQRD
jgi:hypothetical protein